MVSAAGRRTQGACGLYGPLAQLGERQVRNLEARGSIPLWSTKITLKNQRFAPLVFAYSGRDGNRDLL